MAVECMVRQEKRSLLSESDYIGFYFPKIMFFIEHAWEIETRPPGKSIRGRVRPSNR